MWGSMDRSFCLLQQPMWDRHFHVLTSSILIVYSFPRSGHNNYNLLFAVLQMDIVSNLIFFIYLFNIDIF